MVTFLEVQFLEPILTELRPPVGVNFPPDAFFGKQQLQKYMVEFDTLAEFTVAPDILSWSIETTGSTKNAEKLLCSRIMPKHELKFACIFHEIYDFRNLLH